MTQWVFSTCTRILLDIHIIEDLINRYLKHRLINQAGNNELLFINANFKCFTIILNGSSMYGTLDRMIICGHIFITELEQSMVLGMAECSTFAYNRFLVLQSHHEWFMTEIALNYCWNRILTSRSHILRIKGGGSKDKKSRW